LAASEPKGGLVVKGWVRTRRDAKGFSFLELNDGSCLASLQVVVDAGTPGSEDLTHFTTGASVVVEGNLVPSPAPGQKWELRASRIQLVGLAEAGYPLQKKGHTPEFLRIAHLRSRATFFGDVSHRSKLKPQSISFQGVIKYVTAEIMQAIMRARGEMFRVTAQRQYRRAVAGGFLRPPTIHRERATRRRSC
jgi:asparaginyl-tRNA synthetase